MVICGFAQASNLPQMWDKGSSLGSMTLNIFINHWHDGTEYILTRLAGNIELRDEVGISEGRDILLGEPGILEECARRKFNKWGKGYKWVLVDKKLQMSQQCTTAVRWQNQSLVSLGLH